MQDAGSQGIGFLLGSLGVSVAMTSEACYKGLPRTQNGDVITFRGLLPVLLCLYFVLLDFGSGTDIATHLVVVLVHVLLLVGAMLFKKAQGSVVSNQICMKFGRIVMYQLMKDSDF